MKCKSLFCNREIIDEHGSREYCNNNNRCKNKHHAAIKKEELLRYREEESFKLRNEFAIKCFTQLLFKIKKTRFMIFKEFELLNLNLNDDIFFKKSLGSGFSEYKIDIYTILHSEKAGRIYIYR